MADEKGSGDISEAPAEDGKEQQPQSQQLQQGNDTESRHRPSSVSSSSGAVTVIASTPNETRQQAQAPFDGAAAEVDSNRRGVASGQSFIPPNMLATPPPLRPAARERALHPNVKMKVEALKEKIAEAQNKLLDIQLSTEVITPEMMKQEQTLMSEVFRWQSTVNTIIPYTYLGLEQYHGTSWTQANGSTIGPGTPGARSEAGANTSEQATSAASKKASYKDVPKISADDAKKPGSFFTYLTTVANFVTHKGHAEKETTPFLMNVLAGIMSQNALFQRISSTKPEEYQTITAIKKAILKTAFPSSSTELEATLQTVAQKHEETISEYAFRFQELLQALDQNENNHLVLSKFVSGLRSRWIRDQLAIIKSLNDSIAVQDFKRDMSSVAAMVTIASALESTNNAEQGRAAAAAATSSTTTTTNGANHANRKDRQESPKRKETDDHRRDKNHDHQEKRHRQDQSNNHSGGAYNRDRDQRDGKKQWCDYHKSSTHSNDECHNQRNGTKNVHGSRHSSPKPQTTTHHTTYKIPTAMLIRVPDSRLFEPLYSQPTITNYTPASILAMSAYTTLQAKARTEADAKDQNKVFDTGPRLTMTREEIEMEGGLDDKPIFCPIAINEEPEVQTAYLDSGSSRAFMSLSLANKLKIKTFSLDNPEPILTENGLMYPIGITENVVVRAGLQLTLVKFTLFPELQQAEIYLGRPQLRKLGLVTWNIPHELPERNKNAIHTQATQNQLTTHEEEEIETEGTKKHEEIDYIHPDDKMKHETFIKEIEPILQENDKITGFAKTPPIAIKLIERTPKWIHQYNIPDEHKPAVRQQIQKWLKKGKIIARKSEWNFPLTTALKKDKDGNTTGIRVNLDARHVNQKLISDNFTIPNIAEILRSFRKAKYFTEIDLEDAFLQLKVREQDQPILAFTFDGIQYCFVGGIYGVKIMSNYFQRTMASLFTKMPFVKIYIDNITIASETWTQHTEHIKQVLEKLNELNIKISRKKLKIGHRALRILGRLVSKDGVKPDPAKVDRIKRWPFPKDYKAMQSFLGVVNYLRPHLRHCADLEATLNKARNSQTDYEHEAASNGFAMRLAFSLIKEAISMAPLLQYPDPDRPFHVATDASRVGVGAVLYQPTPEQVEVGDTSVTSQNIVALTSRSLTMYEKNYATYKLEMLAVVHAMREFKEFLYGRSFHLHTDHRALTFVLSNGKLKQPNHTLASWVQEISDFDFTITHVPGYLNVLPDQLSRMYTQSDAWGVPNNMASHIETGGAGTAEQIPTLNTLEPTKPSSRKISEKEEYIKLLGRKIPEPSEREKIVKDAHIRGHYGINAVVNYIYNDRMLWWKDMAKDVKEHLGNCQPCQRHEIHKLGYHPMRSPIPGGPMDWVQIDLIHMPTTTDGNSYILVVVDLFTSFVITRPLRTKSAGETAAELLKIWLEFGAPRILQSDKGSEFTNRIMKQINKLFKIQMKISTPYKHSTGSVERVNRTIGTSLKKMLSGDIGAWDKLLPIVQHYYNTTVRTLTKSSPFALMFARATNEAGDEVVEFDVEDWLHDNNMESWFKQNHERLNEWNQQKKRVIDTVYKETGKLIENKRKKMQKYEDKSHRIVKPLEIGTKVMTINTKPTTKYGDQKWIGEYTVTKQTETGTYEITDEQGTKFIRTISQLHPIATNKNQTNNDKEGKQQDEKSYEVEKILRHRGNARHKEYLVKWKNYPHSMNSWVKDKDFNDVYIIAQYWKQITPKRATKNPRKRKHNKDKQAISDEEQYNTDDESIEEDNGGKQKDQPQKKKAKNTANPNQQSKKTKKK